MIEAITPRVVRVSSEEDVAIVYNTWTYNNPGALQVLAHEGKYTIVATLGTLTPP